MQKPMQIEYETIKVCETDINIKQDQQETHWFMSNSQIHMGTKGFLIVLF